MPILIPGAIAWFVAQVLKVILHLVECKKLDRSLFLATGGMPSSHTAFVSAATTKVALLVGTDSVTFGVCVVFALVVMHDAMGVRQSVGIQAKALNELTKHLFSSGITSINQDTIKEVCGHTLLQVCAGLCLGILIGFLF